jgi:hypothetical protein
MVKKSVLAWLLLLVAANVIICGKLLVAKVITCGKGIQSSVDTSIIVREFMDKVKKSFNQS